MRVTEEISHQQAFDQMQQEVTEYYKTRFKRESDLPIFYSENTLHIAYSNIGELPVLLQNKDIRPARRYAEAFMGRYETRFVCALAKNYLPQLTELKKISTNVGFVPNFALRDVLRHLLPGIERIDVVPLENKNARHITNRALNHLTLALPKAEAIFFAEGFPEFDQTNYDGPRIVHARYRY